MKKNGKKNNDTRRKKRLSLFNKKVIVTVILVVVAGLATLATLVWTKPVKADVDVDPFFTLSSGPPKVRIFTPVSNSVDNESSVNVSGSSAPNSVVSVKIDNNLVGTTTANNKGLWSKDVSGLSDGSHTTTASASIGGPLAVVASSMIPGYSIVNLANDTLASSQITGAGSFYGFLKYSSNNATTGPEAHAAIKIKNSNNVYLIRERNILVLNPANYKPTKTIFTNSQFLTSSDENAQDTGQHYRSAVQSPDGSRLYLLYTGGSDNSGKIITINTATNQLLPSETFDFAQGTGADYMAISDDGGKIYSVSTGSNQVSVINTTNGSVSAVTLPTNAMSIVASADGQKMYISRVADSNAEDTNYYVSQLQVDDDSLNNKAIDLGSNYGGGTMYASSSGNKLYIANESNSDLRVVNTSTNIVESTISLPDRVQLGANSVIENSDGTKVYFPLNSNSIAIVSSAADTLVAQIQPPTADFTDLGGIMNYNNKIYATYTRNPGIEDVTNPGNIFSSLGVASADITTDTTAQAVPINGVFSNAISEPVSISSQTISTSSKFSTGTPIVITSPENNKTLTTNKPVIKGTGPKGEKIQIVVNSGTPDDVTVGSDGKWQTQVTLPKGKYSKITAIYQNKRTQLVIPNVFVFGNTIAKTQLSIIDGESDLETQAINLPSIGVSDINLNTAAAINPNGQRYYLVNDNLSFITGLLLPLLTSSETPDVAEIMAQVSVQEIGSIQVYSTQTKQKVATIQLPSGQVPIGISISPDGKKAMVTTANIARIAEFFSPDFHEDLTDFISPIEVQPINLEDNTVTGTPHKFNISLSGLDSSDDPAATIKAFLSIGSAAFFASKSGTYNADGTKFYTTALSPGKYSVINTASGAVSTVTLPQQYSDAIIMSTQLNKKNNTLYATYARVNLPTEESPNPSFVPGIVLVNGSNNQYIGGSVLPELPIFSFAVNASGSKVYLQTVNLTEFISALLANSSNPQGVLLNTDLRFDLGVYDLNAGTYDSYPISGTEVPMNLAIAPNGSKVYIPTLAQNVVHVFDTKTKTMDSGNAPIILNGISLMFGTSDYIGEAVLGSYDSAKNYFVPADVIVEPPTKPPEPEVINNGFTNFRYLPAGQQSSIKPTQIVIPDQATNTVRETISKTVAANTKKEIARTLKNWLIYIFYALLMTALTAIGIIIWRTDMLVGATDEVLI